MLELLKTYPQRLVREWADITLAAHERHGDDFFKKSPAAYFLDNLRHAAQGRRTPPDWWRQMRQEELKRERDAERAQADAATPSPSTEEIAFQKYLETEARDAFHRITGQLIADLTTAGRPEYEARESATTMARLHLLNRFRQEHGKEWKRPGPEKLTAEHFRRAAGL